jgi:hypothetical protein
MNAVLLVAALSVVLVQGALKALPTDWFAGCQDGAFNAASSDSTGATMIKHCPLVYAVHDALYAWRNGLDTPTDGLLPAVVAKLRGHLDAGAAQSIRRSLQNLAQHLMKRVGTSSTDLSRNYLPAHRPLVIRAQHLGFLMERCLGSEQDLVQVADSACIGLMWRDCVHLLHDDLRLNALNGEFVNPDLFFTALQVLDALTSAPEMPRQQSMRLQRVRSALQSAFDGKSAIPPHRRLLSRLSAIIMAVIVGVVVIVSVCLVWLMVRRIRSSVPTVQ